MSKKLWFGLLVLLFTLSDSYTKPFRGGLSTSRGQLEKDNRNEEKKPVRKAWFTTLLSFFTNFWKKRNDGGTTVKERGMTKIKDFKTKSTNLQIGNNDVSAPPEKKSAKKAPRLKINILRKNRKKRKRSVYMLIRTTPHTTHQLKFLKSLKKRKSTFWMQFWRYPSKVKEHADIWTTGYHYRKHLNHMLQIFSIEFKVIITDFIDEIRYPDITMNNIENYDQAYHDFQGLESELFRLATGHSSLVSMTHIGYSTQRRPIHILHIRQNPTIEKPIIFILCGLHSREWLAVSSCQYVLRKLVFDYKYDKEMWNILQQYDIEMVPMLNPDGYVYTHKKYRRWRKTRRYSKNSRCRGVDLNRNFSYKWGGKGSSGNPCSAIYRGREPFSEKESLALARYLYKKRKRLAAFLDVHTYGQMWMSPWGYSKSHPNDYSWQMSALKKIRAAILRATGEQYLYGSSSHLLYRTSGTALDWVYGTLGIVHTYGIELRPDSKTKFNHFKRSAKDIVPSGEDLLVGVKTLGLHMLHERSTSS